MSVYKDKRNGKWAITFYYTDWKGQRKRKRKTGYETKREAKEAEQAELNKKLHSAEMLFSDCYDLYIGTISKEIKASTLDTKLQIGKVHILPVFGSTALNAIKPIDIKLWQGKLKERGLKDSTLRTVHNQLNAVFNFAEKFYGLPLNPARLCGAPKRAEYRNIKFWTLKDYKTYKAFIRGKKLNPTALVVIDLLYWTGIRIGEALALTGDCFNSDNISLTVKQTLYRGVLQTPKTPKSIRTVTMPKEVWDEVMEYKTHLYKYRDKELLFRTTQRAINTIITKASEATGIPKIRIHDLRHSHASLLIQMNVTPLLIKERLGHEDIKTTLNIYSHLYPNEAEKVADKLNKLIQDI